MAIINNSDNTESSKIKQSVINAIQRTTEKSIRDASYDKTILATIQSCTDSSIGQYKIKYQNGYFTAYAQDKSITYANKSTVYVSVQDNDMNNRLFIIGLANDDSTQRISVNFLEGDQMFQRIGEEWIQNKSTVHVELHSYESAWNGRTEFTEVLFKHEYRDISGANVLDLIDDDKIFATLLDSAVDNKSSFRFGADFRVNFSDVQLNSQGDYGIRMKIKYKDSDTLKIYEINTLTMDGTPFNYVVPSSQYHYWEDIDVNNFEYIDSIEAFARYFDFNETEEAKQHPDIYITNFSAYSAERIYSTNNNDCVVKIVTKHGSSNTLSDTNKTVELESFLLKNGNTVNAKNQKLRFFWAKEDANVDNIHHKKYNVHTGKGWYCLNNAKTVKWTNSQASKQDLTEYTIITPKSNAGTVTALEWIDDSNEISLDEDLCPGKETLIKCVIVYENVNYEKTISVKNINGVYLVINATQTRLMPTGYSTLTAGLFRDTLSVSNNYIVSNVTFDNGYIYKWIKTDVNTPNGVTLPITTPEKILKNSVTWEKQSKDKSDGEIKDEIDIVNENNITFKTNTDRYCIERYNYYQEYYDKNKSSNNQSIKTKVERANLRKTNIITYSKSHINDNYIQNMKNLSSLDIMGPTRINLQPETQKSPKTELLNGELEPIYYGSQDYDSYKNILNTLYMISAQDIYNSATYQVVVSKAMADTGLIQQVASQNIVLRKDNGSGLDYTVRITNGQRSFVYNNAGVVTTATETNPYLTFTITDRDGTLVYDSSQDEDSEVNKANASLNMNTLQPKWSFYDTNVSLIKTNYIGDSNTVQDPQDTRLYHLSSTEPFEYNVVQNYNYNKATQSNIELDVIINGELYHTQTDFNFLKEGDLGTNGTGMTVDILDGNYDNYKKAVLDLDAFSRMSHTVKNTKTSLEYDINARHLNNTYLFATIAYSDEANTNVDLNGNFVNLQIAQGFTQGTSDQGLVIEGQKQMTLSGQWTDSDGNTSDLTQQAKWTIEGDSFDKSQDDQNNYSPSLIITGTGRGSVCNFQLKDVGTSYHPRYYKPSKIIVNNKNRISNNTIRVQDSHAVSSKINPDSSDVISRTIYAYYPIPYYFFSIVNTAGIPTINDVISDLDPARHIVVTGGFDQVIYDATGAHPEYNKQEDFVVHIFDENNKEITDEIISSGNGTITWTCSDGFSKTIINPVDYNSLPDDMPLLNRYCRFNGIIYKCITQHKKNHGIVYIKNKKGKIKKTYGENDPTQFIPEYWEEIDQTISSQKVCSLKPADLYREMFAADTFHSWVDVKVQYTQRNDHIYYAEAFIPINILCNQYGNDIINAWDGKRAAVGDNYLIAPQIAAGKKNNNNSFEGITLGTAMYGNKTRVGLFGYRSNENSQHQFSTTETMYINARTGRAIFGADKGAQIILDPKADKNHWSRIAGWFMNEDYFYKAVGSNIYDTAYGDDDSEIKPHADDTSYGSFGIYVPKSKDISSSDVCLWASSVAKDVHDLDDEKQAIKNFHATYLQRYGVTINTETLDITNRTSMVSVSQNRITHYARILEFIRILHDTSSFTLDKIKQLDFDDDLTPEMQDLFGLTSATATSQKIQWFRDFKSEIDSCIHDDPQIDKQDLIDALHLRYLNKKEEEEDRFTRKMNYIDQYEAMVDAYHQEQEKASIGTNVLYSTVNKKKANFYVTYGGHMHAASASIEGSVVATSGSFGSGVNKLQINVNRDGTDYVLYNKHFRVAANKDGDAEPAVFMNGKIYAKEGQIGSTSDDADGHSSSTLFIMYRWYPWHLPADNEEWNDNTLYEDTSAGMNKKYVLYHRNFWIDTSGQTFFNGTLYAKKGRIGQWILSNYGLRNSDSSVQLNPSGLQLGNFYAYPSGAIGGANWSISANGEAHFTNDLNEFNGHQFTVPNGAGGFSGLFAGQGLELAAGEYMTIGNEKLTAYDDGEGFSFSGKARFAGDINMGPDANIRLDQGTVELIKNGAGSLKLDGGGLSFNGSGGASISMNINGLSLGNRAITDAVLDATNKINIGMKIDGADKTLAEYINDAIEDKLKNKLSLMVQYGQKVRIEGTGDQHAAGQIFPLE